MIRLNLGGGNFHQDGWVNVDYPFEARAHKQRPGCIDVVHNFMDKKPIALPDGSVDVVYTEHCIEHLTDDAVIFLFEDVYRLLKAGGVFRISCPDANIIYDRYVDETVEHIGFNSRLANDPKEIELLDAVATPLVPAMEAGTVRALYEALGKHEFFTELTSRVCADRSNQELSPGYHLSWWSYYRLVITLTDVGFRKCRQRGQRESGIEDLRQDFIDRTAPTFSVRVECGK